jgi:soluble lytic murein transglycosylase-like protein
MQKGPKPSRVLAPFAASALFAAFVLVPSPSVPSVPDSPLSTSQLAAAEELQTLAGWVSGRDADAGELRALRPADLEGAMRPDRRTFELFRHDAADLARRRVLEDLPFGQALAETAARNRVDGLLLAAVVEAESRFSPRAVSPRGAVGLMQLMPATGAMYDAGDLRDPHVNLEIGSRYLGSLIELYDGNLEMALAAYNAGPAAVERYRGVPPFAETRAYVKKVLARYLEHRESAKAAEAEAPLAVEARLDMPALTPAEAPARPGIFTASAPFRRPLR